MADRGFFHGTTMVYRVTPRDEFGIDCCQCDYDVSMEVDSRPQDARAIREEARGKGKKPRKLRYDELQNELLVILGPGMSANGAVSQLERLIKVFRERGMLCGRDSTEEYVMETVGKDARRYYD